MFQPYFINFNTIIHYEQQTNKVSIEDILEMQFTRKLGQNKLYFRLDLEDDTYKFFEFDLQHIEIFRNK